MKEIQEKALLCMEIFLLIKKFIDDSYDYDLFLVVFVFKNRDITKEIAEEEFFITNFYRWKKEMMQKISYIESRLVEMEFPYHISR